MPGLEPFSEYRLTVNVFNKKGNGPNSDPVTFNTTEGGEVTQDTQLIGAHYTLKNTSYYICMTWWTVQVTQTMRKGF